MDFLRATTLPDALAARAAQPHAVPIAGGTDVMLALRQDCLSPEALLDISRVPEFALWLVQGENVRVGACVTYTRLVDELHRQLPGLAMAAAAVGSRQIRNRGTLGGCLGTAAPSGDAHAAMLACDAIVEVSSVRGSRQIPAADFYLAAGRNALQKDELVTAVLVPRPAGPQRYSRIAARRALAVAAVSFGLSLDLVRRRVATGVGGAVATPVRALAAEDFLVGELAAAGLWETRASLPSGFSARFGDLVASAVDAIDDDRAASRYRRYALGVLARRTLDQAWSDYQIGWRCC